MIQDGLHFISRSEGVDRIDCRRLRLLGNDLDDLGYRPKAGSIPLLSGDGFHRGFARVLGHYSGLKPIDFTGYDDVIDLIVAETIATYRDEVLEAGVRNLVGDELQFTIAEQQTMLEGMMRGWVDYRLPHILDEYDVVEIEQQWAWQLGPGIYMPMRQDAILRRKDDGMLYIMDYKGIPYVYDDWMQKHESSDQTVLYITALEERTGETVGGMFYEGLVRGQWRKETAKFSPYHGRKIQMSPYCYGYGNFDGETPLVQSAYTNRKGYMKFRVADRFIVKEWLEVLRGDGEEKPNVLAELFISMQPVNPPPEFRERIRQQRYMNEVRYLDDLAKFKQLEEKRGLEHPETQMHLSLFAEQNLDRCDRYGAEYRCPFKPFCTSPGGGLDLLRVDEAFEKRKPHHDIVLSIEEMREQVKAA